MSTVLKGKVALVTGASKGIGAAIARQLAAAGAAVAVNYSTSRAGADVVVNEIQSRGGKAVAVQGNVALPADAARIVDETVKQLGGIDILINNAGIYEFAPLEDITAEHFHRQFNVNVLGLLLVTQAAVRHFPKSGGSIVNISSLVSTYAPPQTSVYSATKGAVDTITISLSKELGARGIRVNAIRPGMVETEGAHAAGISEGSMKDQILASTPLGRIGQPHDIASAAVFLASDESSWITGETLLIAGGLQ